MSLRLIRASLIAIVVASPLLGNRPVRANDCDQVWRDLDDANKAAASDLAALMAATRAATASQGSSPAAQARAQAAQEQAQAKYHEAAQKP